VFSSKYPKRKSTERKKKKQKEEERKKQHEGSAGSPAVESGADTIDGEPGGLPVGEDDGGEQQMSEDNTPKRLIDVHA